MDFPEKSITVQLDETKILLLQHNREILTAIIKAIIYLGKQGLAYRNKGEIMEDKNYNRGNFYSLLNLLGDYSPSLREHLLKSQTKHQSSTYLSPRIQNELISIIANEFILYPLLEEIRAAKYYTILADEISSHKTNQLAFCLRFVDSNRSIREEFLQFSKVQRTNGETVAAEILQTLEAFNLPLEDARGQGYDGAGGMASETLGVQGRILRLNPKALYQHCASHSLALVIVQRTPKLRPLMTYQ
jgi:hypothetical protein